MFLVRASYPTDTDEENPYWRDEGLEQVARRPSDASGLNFETGIRDFVWELETLEGARELAALLRQVEGCTVTIQEK